MNERPASSKAGEPGGDTEKLSLSWRGRYNKDQGHNDFFSA
jgi:hypothetical protein